MHNNLNMIIKIYSTIYLSLTLIFPSVLSYWHHESWVHKTRKIIYSMAKKGSTFNLCFSNAIESLRTIFKLIKFY